MPCLLLADIGVARHASGLCLSYADGALEYIQVELDMFRMTALFVVERNKAHLLAEIFKLLKLSAQASRHLLNQPKGTSEQGSPRSRGKTREAGEESDLMGFNPMLMRKRNEGRVSMDLAQMSSGTLSDDDGNLNDASLMSRSALPASLAQQESGMRCATAACLQRSCALSYLSLCHPSVYICSLQLHRGTQIGLRCQSRRAAATMESTTLLSAKIALRKA